MLWPGVGGPSDGARGRTAAFCCMINGQVLWGSPTSAWRAWEGRLDWTKPLKLKVLSLNWRLFVVTWDCSMVYSTSLFVTRLTCIRVYYAPSHVELYTQGYLVYNLTMWQHTLLNILCDLSVKINHYLGQKNRLLDTPWGHWWQYRETSDPSQTAEWEE